MPRKQPSGLTRFFRDFIRQTFAARERQIDRNSSRRLKFESLEGRQLMASDLGAITGVVSTDAPVVGATVNLYADDGDGVFEPAAGDGAATADLTDATGRYRFDRLAAGNYWIEQPAQTVGAEVLGLFVSPLLTISAAQAAGTAGTVIDDFADSPAASVTADLITSPNSLAADHAGALGAERDMIVTLETGLVLPSVTLSSAGNQLVFDSSADAQGLFNVIYDGNDDAATTLAATGLGGIDLTQSGVNTAVKVRAQADQAGATVRLRVYTDATNFSDSAAIVIPSINTAEDFVFHFSQFTTAGGTGADFTSVGAIDLLIDTNTNATDGIVTVLGAFAPIAVTQDIDNEIDLSVTKTVSNATPAVSQNVTFTITVANPAGGPQATGIVVTDDLPAGLTFVSASTATGSYDEDTDLWTVGSIAPGGTATLDIVAMVTGSAQVTNTAQITAADQPDANTANNTESESVDAVATANLSLTQTVTDDTPNLNSQITFNLTLSNAGPDAATGVVVTDQLPAGLTIGTVTASTGTSYNSTTGVWTIGTVNSGANATLSIVATVTTAGPLTSVAEVTAVNEADPNSTPNNHVEAEDDQQTVTVDAISADLSLTVTPPSQTPNVGQDTTLTITLTNGGPDTATNVVVTDVIPAGLTLQSSNPAAGTTYASNVWTIPSLASGANVVLTLTVRATTSAALTYTTQVTASDVVDPDSTPNDNTGDDRATATIDAPGAADLSLTKTVTSNTPNFGSNVTFTLTVANAGPDQATGVVVTDLLPTGLVFVSSTPSQGSYVATTGVWTVGTINNGSSATLSIVARVNSTAAINNVAQVTASGVFDPDSTPNDGAGDDRDVETIDAPAAADLRLAKTIVGPSVVNVGQNLTFRLTLNNDGPDQATGVTVSDVLPAGLTFVSSTPSQGTYDNVTGVWTVGSVNNGASATLDIVATLTTPGAKTNTAQVTASGQFDPDSTPNDNTGDDRATVGAASTRLSKRRFLAR